MDLDGELTSFMSCFVFFWARNSTDNDPTISKMSFSGAHLAALSPQRFLFPKKA